MVEVFKTNVMAVDQSQKLIKILLVHYPKSRINFDIEDCDKVLRVEGEFTCPKKIIEVLNAEGYECCILD